jgi:hypothetical protein
VAFFVQVVKIMAPVQVGPQLLILGLIRNYLELLLEVSLVSCYDPETFLVYLVDHSVHSKNVK